MRVRFIHGRRYPLKCKKCDAVREGIVYRELVEWRARMACGHHRRLGYTMPLDELNNLGLVNEDWNAPMQQTKEEDDEVREVLAKGNRQ